MFKRFILVLKLNITAIRKEGKPLVFLAMIISLLFEVHS